jgi:hypothetical protein
MYVSVSFKAVGYELLCSHALMRYASQRNILFRVVAEI